MFYGLRTGFEWLKSRDANSSRPGTGRGGATCAAARLLLKATGKNHHRRLDGMHGSLPHPTPRPPGRFLIQSLRERCGGWVGIEASLKKQGAAKGCLRRRRRSHVRYRSGISGAFERGHDITYICYDNEPT